MSLGLAFWKRNGRYSGYAPRTSLEGNDIVYHQVLHVSGQDLFVACSLSKKKAVMEAVVFVQTPRRHRGQRSKSIPHSHHPLCLLRSPRPTTKRDICSGSITRVGDLPRFCRCLRKFLLLPVRRRKMEDQASLCTLVAKVTDAFSPSPALVLSSRS
ncbi:uncharacterized protein BT62DRAFT_1014312 [Guyanagaster necrorhizus]|uniref:Uncharacterized protein n=1 Tax=Guyanagaster necrorhizus TaxID=856835 RepID=A0A9P7VDY2_9AGAR|nr:uncharacterized protein BT62DRAFT_1014312 [Guyanagaster necrorhizus MCA 3950]KAG7439141.1 hypothetical protein BT62DRAFT_1014312 [Guyanagaster necrorhizus MCA 3950]